MEPATTAIVSAGVGAAGSLVSGFAQNSKDRSQAKVYDANAQIVQDEAAAQADQIRNKAIRVQGSQRAQSGASGIQGTGFADAIVDSSTEAELDARTALWNGKMQARNMKAQAGALRQGGTASLIGGVFGAGTTALSGYGQWQRISSKTDPYGVY